MPNIGFVNGIKSTGGFDGTDKDGDARVARGLFAGLVSLLATTIRYHRRRIYFRRLMPGVTRRDELVLRPNLAHEDNAMGDRLHGIVTPNSEVELKVSLEISVFYFCDKSGAQVGTLAVSGK